MRNSLADFLRQQKVDVHDYMTAMEFYRDYHKPVPGVLVSEIHLRGMSGIELFRCVTWFNEINGWQPNRIAGTSSQRLTFATVRRCVIRFMVSAPSHRQSLKSASWRARWNQSRPGRIADLKMGS